MPTGGWKRLGASDNALWQRVAGGPQWRLRLGVLWADHHGRGRRGRNADGRLSLRRARQCLMAQLASGPNGGWSGWSLWAGSSASDPVLGQNADGPARGLRPRPGQRVMDKLAGGP